MDYTSGKYGPSGRIALVVFTGVARNLQCSLCDADLRNVEQLMDQLVDRHVACQAKAMLQVSSNQCNNSDLGEYNSAVTSGREVNREWAKTVAAIVPKRRAYNDYHYYLESSHLQVRSNTLWSR